MELKQTRDSIVDKLTETRGEELQITSNITRSEQIDAVMDGYISMQLGSRYARDQVELLLRLSLGWQGRARDDLTGIGKTPDYNPGWTGGGDDEDRDGRDRRDPQHADRGCEDRRHAVHAVAVRETVRPLPAGRPDRGPGGGHAQEHRRRLRQRGGRPGRRGQRQIQPDVADLPHLRPDVLDPRRLHLRHGRAEVQDTGLGHHRRDAVDGRGLEYREQSRLEHPREQGPGAVSGDDEVPQDNVRDVHPAPRAPRRVHPHQQDPLSDHMHGNGVPVNGADGPRAFRAAVPQRVRADAAGRIRPLRPHAGGRGDGVRGGQTAQPGADHPEDDRPGGETDEVQTDVERIERAPGRRHGAPRGPGVRPRGDYDRVRLHQSCGVRQPSHQRPQID